MNVDPKKLSDDALIDAFRQRAKEVERDKLELDPLGAPDAELAIAHSRDHPRSRQRTAATLSGGRHAFNNLRDGILLRVV